MRIQSGIHVVALLVALLMQGVVGQQERGGFPVFPVMFGISALLGIFVGCYLMSSLMEKDKQLPEDHKYMTEGKVCLFWLMCLCG